MQIDQKIIGVDLGGTNMRAALIQGNRIVHLNTKLVNKCGSADDIFNDLISIIENVIDDETAGIGVGVPSIVDVEKGIVYNVANIPSWEEVHIKERLEKHFNIPVYVNNDANCFAAGEKFYGKGINYNSFVGLIVGTGLGAGLVINNKLYEGSNCGAGEFGCINYINNNNYEYYCSGQFFTNVHKVSAYETYQKAYAGDKEALKIFNEFGEHLGNAIQMILYAYDPECIVLGGSVSKSFDYFKAGLYKSLDSFLFKKTIKSLKIEVSELDNIAIYGAAALYFNAGLNHNSKVVSHV
jgi:glucokinase